jgi:hypothetical protein
MTVGNYPVPGLVPRPHSLMFTNARNERNVGHEGQASRNARGSSMGAWQGVAMGARQEVAMGAWQGVAMGARQEVAMDYLRCR